MKFNLDKNPIDSKKLGAQNERLILSLLRKHGRISQTELRKQTNLSSSTTSYIISRLRNKALIKETRGESTQRGAKPILIEINPEGCYAVGVEINPNIILLGLFDFNGSLIDTIRVTCDKDKTPENICLCIEVNFKNLLSKHKIKNKKLVGAGVALSGSISSDGLVELSSPLGWKSVPLKTMLETRLNTTVTVCTTRVRLLAEISGEPDKKYNNVLYLNVADGVGSHIIMDGHLLHGATNKSGEIGHIIVEPDGPECGCGNKGCLETFISGPSLAGKILEDINARQKTSLAEIINSDDSPVTIISKWGEAIKYKDPYSLELRSYLSNYFCPAAAAAINCFDPDLIIIAGYVTSQCYDYLENQLRQTFLSDVYDNARRDIKIMPAHYGDEALIYGAGRTIFQNYFNSL